MEPRRFAVYIPEDLEGRLLLTGKVGPDGKSFTGTIETTGPIVILSQERYEALRDAARDRHT